MSVLLEPGFDDVLGSEGRRKRQSAVLFVGFGDVEIYHLVLRQRNQVAVDSNKREYKSEGEPEHAYHEQLLSVGLCSREYIFEDIDLGRKNKLKAQNRFDNKQALILKKASTLRLL